MINENQRCLIANSLERFIENKYTDEARLVEIEKDILSLNDPKLSLCYCCLCSKANIRKHIMVCINNNDMERMLDFVMEFKNTLVEDKELLKLMSDAIFKTQNRRLISSLVHYEILPFEMAEDHLWFLMKDNNENIDWPMSSVYKEKMQNLIENRELNNIRQLICQTKNENN